MASMRPRHKAAENRAGGMPMMPLDEIASMRPRHKAAENSSAISRPSCQRRCFNEAAA